MLHEGLKRTRGAACQGNPLDAMARLTGKLARWRRPLRADSNVSTLLSSVPQSFSVNFGLIYFMGEARNPSAPDVTRH
jgi:hypothetical protein